MKTKNVTEKNMKVCLVGSSGGHLTHLYMLKPFWKDKNRFWVTFDKEDARSLLEGEKVYPCYFPTNRSIKALIKNTKIAWDVLHARKVKRLVRHINYHFGIDLYKINRTEARFTLYYLRTGYKQCQKEEYFFNRKTNQIEPLKV